MSGSRPGVVLQVEVFQGKMFEGQKSRRQLSWGDFLEGNCLGGAVA